MKKTNFLKTLLVAVGLTTAIGANAYDTPNGYKVGTVYVGYEQNNQVLAETFANCTNDADLTSLSTNWSSTVGGTKGYFWAKIKNIVRTVSYPATDKATLFTCKKYSATNDGGKTTQTIYSDNDGATYYSYNDLQTVFDATGYEVNEDGTSYQIPSYVYGKCISLQHRDKGEYTLDYTLPSAVSTGKLVFGADFYRIQNVTAPLYIQFYDSENNLVFQLGHDNGSGRRTLQYKVGTAEAVGGAGYTEYRVYHGWGLKDMVFDLDAGTVSYIVDNVHYDGKTSANRRKVTQSAINFGTGKNIAKVRFSVTGGGSSTNYDLFVDNMYLYTLISGSATTTDMTFVGSKDYEDGYLANNSDDYTIKPNGKLHLQFKNYGSGAYNWNNWIALFNNANKSSNLAYIRADAWDLASSSNTGISTSSNYWDAFESDMYGSTVAMDITRTDGNVNMLATITTAASEVMTLTFDKAIGNASEDIVFRLSEDAACLVIDNTKTVFANPPSFSQTGISNIGNPIITITGSGTPSVDAVYYTTNGSTPTSSSSVYADPVTVTGGNTIKAICVAVAADGTTTLTSNADLMETTAYVAAQTYDFSALTLSEVYAEGFSWNANNVNYGLGSTTRCHKNDGQSALTIMDGVRTGYSGSNDTNWYWMVGQGLWQSGGNRSVTLCNTVEGEVALFTQNECVHDGTNWVPTESENYESDCSFGLNKSNNKNQSGGHVYILKKVQTFVPVGTTVSATIGSTGWTTFASPYALDLSAMTASTGDVTAYYASTVTGSSVKMTETNKADVKAGEGLALYGTPSAVITIPVVASGTAIDGNLLKGCTTETVLAKNSTSGYNNYVLVNNAGVPQFQSLADMGATIPAGKAYLQYGEYSADARALSIMFDDDETTGLGRIENSESSIENAVYNLQGQRINSSLRKGLYIKNGKKVIVK